MARVQRWGGTILILGLLALALWIYHRTTAQVRPPSPAASPASRQDTTSAGGRLRYFTPGKDGYSETEDLNNAGQVLVWMTDKSYLWTARTGLRQVAATGTMHALNEAGVLAGGDRDGAFLQRPDSTRRRLSTPMGLGSEATALNAHGQAAGTLREPYARHSPGETYAACWSAAGTLRRLGKGEATCINNAGVVGGAYETRDGTRHACLWLPDGRRRLLDRPESTYGQVEAINDRGHAVGWVAKTSGPSHRGRFEAVFWTPDEGLRRLQVPGSQEGMAVDINAHDVVALNVLDLHGLWHAYLWSPTGGFRDLSLPDGRSWRLRGLNDAGQVVGMVEDDRTNQHCGYLWTPEAGAR